MKIPSLPAIGLMLWSAGALPAATVVLTELSDPPGFLSRSSSVESATPISTLVAPLESNGFRFTGWKLNGVRQEDTLGRAWDQVTFTIFEHTTATAFYLPIATDADGDGIPDWFETYFHGSLANGAAADSDGDGLNLLQEYERDVHPGMTNEVRDGGVSRASSATVYAILSPGYSHYVESSAPPGFLSRHLLVANGSTVLSTAVALENNGFMLGELAVNGVRQQDATGRALAQVSLTVAGDTAVVARYFPTGEDTDADGIPDWYEWLFHGTLAHGAATDTDGDGLDLWAEYERDLHPGLWNEVRDGGISRASSTSTLYNLDGFHRYTIKSQPDGFVPEDNGVVATGTAVTTPNLNGEASGYFFTAWTVNGVRQTTAEGIPLGQVTFAVVAESTVVAHYVPAAEDADADGVPDWYELRYFGNLAQGAGSDVDGDGLTLREEFERDQIPVLANEVRDGGVSRAESSLATVNLQPFERIQFALVQGNLQDLFTFDPNVLPLSGTDFGDHSAPALCDWDGDGDWDLFVATEAGLRVFENIGTRHTMNFAERTAQFAGLAGMIAAVTSPVLSSGDWNRDGREDLVVGGATGDIAAVASSGNFGSAQPSAASFTVATGSLRALPALGDVDGDGRADLLAVLDDGTVRLYPHNGSNSAPYVGTPTENILGTAIPNATSAAVARVTDDLLPDVLVADGDGRVWEFHGGSGGGFTLKSKVWGGTGSGFGYGVTIAARDFDGDGDTDAICGLTNGALMALRDPRLGPPAGLAATSGASSVLLNWEPDRQSRVRGYYIYRDLSSTGSGLKLTASPYPSTEYLDSSLSLSTTYFYHVTGVTASLYPGNSVPTLIEGPSSDIVSATTSVVRLALRAARGGSGQKVKVALSIDNPTGLVGSGMDIRVSYNPSQLTPMSQINGTEPGVSLSGLSQNLAVTDNGATANGELRIMGASGEVERGQGKLFTLSFRVAAGLPTGAVIALGIGSATLRDAQGNTILAQATPGAIRVGSTFGEGDLTGDGVANGADKALLMELIRPKARIPTDDELAAGDLNGNGELDQHDLVLLKQLLEGMSP